MIDTIFQFGEDALNNEASISIDTSTLTIPGLGEIIGMDELKFRAIEFSVPEKEIATYDQSYKGFTIQRWKAGTGMNRTVDVTFRIDKYWKVYRFLRGWMEAISDLEGDGSFYPDVSDGSLLRTTMTIQQIANTLDANGDSSETIVGNGWVFTGVWPRTMPQISFNTTEGGSQQTISVTFGFLNYKMGDDA